MKLFTFPDISSFFKKTKEPVSRGVILRPNYGQGPFTPYFRNFVPRKINADFMEFLRESIPIVDGAINRLVSLDGHIEVKGDNAKLVDEIKDWIYNVPVNSLQKGLQAYHQSITAEAHEQGFALGEFITNNRRNDIVELKTADSKFIKFKRDKSGNGIEILQKSDDDIDWRPLKQDNLQYFSLHNENQNPYGVPLMRSCEFVSQILLTIQNSTKNVWERFGDPSFSIIYKTSKKDGADLNQRKQTIEDEFNAALRAKADGKSADFIRAIDTNSEIEIKIIGADGQLIPMEVPARHVLEQIVGKTGLPPWMLGLHWSTTERLSNQEAEMILADVVIRQSAKMPLFFNLVQNLLLLRGRTWKKGEWTLEWAGVNLHDIVAQAQARFLNAQADMMTSNSNNTNTQDKSRRGGFQTRPRNDGKTNVCELTDNAGGFGTRPYDTVCGQKETRPSPWPELDKIEAEYLKALKTRWTDLLVKVSAILGLTDTIDSPASTSAEKPVTISIEQKALILADLKRFIDSFSLKTPDSPIIYYYRQAISAGLFKAVNLISETQPLLNAIKNKEIFDYMLKDGFNLVKNSATLAIKESVLTEIEAHVIAGTNPVHIAARLEKLFGDQNSDWERLVQSEMAQAAELAKKEEWKEWGVETMDFVPAPDGCALCQSLAGEYPINECPIPVQDTHPRCRCSTRPGAKK